MARIIALLLLTLPAIAAADSIYIGGWSTHFRDVDQRCERHDLIAYSAKGYTIGRFKNSYCAPTWIATKRLLEWYPATNLRTAIHAGATYGYHTCNKGYVGTRRTHNKWCPAASLEFAYTRYQVQPAVLITGDAFIFTFNIQL